MTCLLNVICAFAFAFLAAATLLPIAPASAGNLVPIKPQHKDKDGDYWIRWRIEGVPDIQLEYHGGYEYGGEYYLLRRGKNGKFKPVLYVEVALRDGKGRLYWTDPNPEVTLPIESGPDGPQLWATLDHRLGAEGYESCYPPWQKRLPLLMLTGRGSRESRIPARYKTRDTFKLIALERLIALAKRKGPANGPNLGGCDEYCCIGVVLPEEPAPPPPYPESLPELPPHLQKQIDQILRPYAATPAAPSPEFPQTSTPQDEPWEPSWQY